MAYPEPANVAPWYLRNITQALGLDEATGNVYLRTDSQIIGNVSVGNVAIGALGNIDISGNDMPVTGNVTVFQGTDPWQISGNVVITSGNIDITSLPEVEIKNDTGNPIPISGNTSVNSVTNPIYVEGVNNSSFFAPTQSDAFGRLRVSNPQTLFDTQNQYSDPNQFSSKKVGAGNVAYDPNSSTFLMSVTGTGDQIIRETDRTFIYQPGKSLLIMNTFAMNTPTAGVTQRVGYYDGNNGIFFEVNGTTLSMVIRSKSSGAVQEDRITRDQWNGDPLDGTGASGITLNVARTQIFWMDIEWLGVGSVRTGFVIDGQYIVCNTFNHANQPGNFTTYMGSAILPLRYELSTTGPAATMRQICSSVISEGGYAPTGRPFSIGHDLGTPVRLPNDKSFVPLIAIRLKSTCPNAIAIPKDYTIVPEDQALVKYVIYNRAVTSGGSWLSAGSDSAVEYNLSPGNVVVDGRAATTGFLISNNQSINTPQGSSFDFEDQLQRNPFVPTMYEYVIAAATTGTNIDVYASINWQEIT